jgi:hypothetical protein
MLQFRREMIETRRRTALHKAEVAAEISKLRGKPRKLEEVLALARNGATAQAIVGALHSKVSRRAIWIVCREANIHVELDSNERFGHRKEKNPKVEVPSVRVRECHE